MIDINPQTTPLKLEKTESKKSQEEERKIESKLK